MVMSPILSCFTHLLLIFYERSEQVRTVQGARACARAGKSSRHRRDCDSLGLTRRHSTATRMRRSSVTRASSATLD